MSRRKERVISVGLMIHDARRRARINQIVAAKLIGVSRTTWSEWECGHRIPLHLDHVLHVLRLLGDDRMRKVAREAEKARRKAEKVRLRACADTGIWFDPKRL